MGAASAALPFNSSAQESPKSLTLTIEDLKAFQKVAGLSFSDDELKEVLQDVNDRLADFASVRAQPITERTQPPLVFTPWSSRPVRGRGGISARVEGVHDFTRPSNEEDLAFLSVRELGYLLRTRQVTSVALTELSLKRLERYGDKLLCLVTLLRDQALDEARQ